MLIQKALVAVAFVLLTTLAVVMSLAGALP